MVRRLEPPREVLVLPSTPRPLPCENCTCERFQGRVGWLGKVGLVGCLVGWLVGCLFVFLGGVEVGLGWFIGWLVVLGCGSCLVWGGGNGTGLNILDRFSKGVGCII